MTTRQDPCGCKHEEVEGGTDYQPCLSCALIGAGHMLHQAGLRIAEALAAQAQTEEQTDTTPESMGGSD